MGVCCGAAPGGDLVLLSRSSISILIFQISDETRKDVEEEKWPLQHLFFIKFFFIFSYFFIRFFFELPASRRSASKKEGSSGAGPEELESGNDVIVPTWDDSPIGESFFI
ncbi:uncharacterized protein LOC127285307 [Leptopilina boulardi]|uniref:uncharacterized protein LOC127285307 n=1 Tax=Leptopilina boulardi TaxID=63433 RepID=UPI0021F529C0|nr:uncharacterized protein LOC127285307 [Leptopilina boulardi]